MVERNIWKIVILLSVLSLTTAKLDFKLHYCRFKCSDQCEIDDASNDAPKPGAFYWRDFYGAIPTDAYPLGSTNQNPQTYIGMAYDPSKNATLTTTIVEGLDYVHTVYKGQVSKQTKHIQILCTREPERMTWMNLTPENIKMLKDAEIVKGGIQTGTQGRMDRHFIVKASKCMVSYAGYVARFNVPMEYALLDGTLETTETFMWLVYKKKTAEETQQKRKNKNQRPFFSHHYEYSTQPNSIIPKFFKQINVGPCSVICTNEGMSKQSKLKGNNKLLSTMAYYWKPNAVFDVKEALPIGPTLSGKPLYLGQSHTHLSYDVGQTDGSSVSISVSSATLTSRTYFHILSSNFPEKFEWVNSSSDTFAMLDKSRVISGGQLNEGTDTFVGREFFQQKYYLPGSIQPRENGTNFRSYYGPTNNFEVLMFKDPKKN